MQKRIPSLQKAKARTIALGLMMAAAAATTATARAQTGSVVNQFQWEYAFPGSAIPIAGNEQWTVFKGNTTPPPHHRGETLALHTNDTLVQQIYYTSTEWNPSVETGEASVEARLRLEAVAEGSMNNAVVVLAVGTQSGGTALYLGPGGLYLFPGSGEPLVSGFDPFEPHSYRLILNTAGNLFSLEIDGEEKLTDHPLSGALKGNLLRIGDMSSSVGGIVHYEYVVWNNATHPKRDGGEDGSAR